MADALPALERAASGEWRMLALLLTFLAGLLGWQNGLGRPDYTLYDAALTLSGQQPSDDILIIAIDEPSLRAIGRWPWPRAVHAALLEKLGAAKPRAIGLDLILAEPESTSAGATGAGGTADTVLARALRQAAPVVLPVLMESSVAKGAVRATLPLAPLAAAAAALGHIHVEIDSDGIARSVFLLEGLGGAAALEQPAPPAGNAATATAAALWPHFALALDRAGAVASDAATTGATPPAGGITLAATVLPGERAPAAAAAGAWRRDHWIHIPFAGPPGTYRRVSYIDVLLERVPASALTGKTILVGATAAGLGDAYPTPLSGQSSAMPGVEINANVLDTLRTGRAIVRTPAAANALVSAAIVLLVMTGLFRLTPRHGLALVATSIVAVLAGAWAALVWANTWFAPTACLVSLVLAYPLWSWRRLEATMVYLDDELSRLEAEPDILPRPPARNLPTSGDALEHRILAVEATAQRLRDTRRFAADTLGNLPDATLVADSAGKILLANRTAAHSFKLGAASDLHGRYIADLFGVAPAQSGRGVSISWDALRESALQSERAAALGGRVAATAAEPGAALDASPVRHDHPAPAANQSATPQGLDGGQMPTPEQAVDATAETTAAAGIEISTRDGRRMLAHCARSPNTRGETIGWIVSLIDISALRAAETKRDEVLAFLSHDMRAPQSSILALIELHALDPANNTKEEVHSRIETYARKTLDLSEQFLQLSRAETKEYEFAAVDLSQIAEEAIDEVWVAASAKNIRVKLVFDGEPAPVNADRAMLTRATVNLLTNAVKYSPERTEIKVSVTTQNGQFILAVADKGYGISTEDQRRLFERYRRFSTPGQPKAAGAGLGMVFVKTVVEKHGGRINVASEVGRGTTITMLLPPYAG